MKTIKVVAAVIQRQKNDKKRNICKPREEYGEFAGGWEFPGGKIEEGETPQEALIREIKEELDADILVGDLIDVVEYDYPNFHLSMNCYWCELKSEHVELKEHEDAKWLVREELATVDWLPADITLIKKIEQSNI